MAVGDNRTGRANGTQTSCDIACEGREQLIVPAVKFCCSQKQQGNNKCTYSLFPNKTFFTVGYLHMQCSL